MKGYHFTSDKLRDGRPVPPIGEWLEHEGDVIICKSGLHASQHPFDALTYAPGHLLHKVIVEGDIVKQDDKFAGRRRKIVATIDAEDLLRKFARMCALDVIDKWDAPDVVVRYLKTGDESLRSTARAAAWAAARAAAWDAARAAAWGPQRRRLGRMVREAFNAND